MKNKDERNIVIVGGDIHLGGFHHVWYKDYPFCHQVVSSAVCNNSFPKILEDISNMAIKQSETVSVKGFNFKAYADKFIVWNNIAEIFTYKNNYDVASYYINLVSREPNIKGYLRFNESRHVRKD